MNTSKLTLKTQSIGETNGAPLWLPDLFAGAVNPSVFLSPAWVDTWFPIYGGAFTGEWLSWWAGDQCVAGCVVLARSARKGPFPLRLAVLNTAAEVDENSPYIEFNDILCRDGHQDEVVKSLAEHLRTLRWDQLYLPGYTENSVLSRLAQHELDAKWDSIPKGSPFIDLVPLRTAGIDSNFSSNTRTQIKRSMKLYAQRGELKVTCAATVHEAHSYLEELARLHQAVWIKRGEPGGFKSPRFIEFHKALTAALWRDGRVELLRMSAGDHTIGYLYNFLHAGKVSFYQSGFAYESDAKIKPGLVAHYLAVQRYLANGLEEYDFMAGESRYKRSLAKSMRHLTWTWVERRNLRMRLIDYARAARKLAKPGREAAVATSDEPA